MRSMVQNFRFLIRIARKLQIIESRNCLQVKGNFLFSSFALSFTASYEKSAYLTSSLVNLVDLCVPHQFLHRILAIEARSAEDLNVNIIAANESISTPEQRWRQPHWPCLQRSTSQSMHSTNWRWINWNFERFIKVDCILFPREWASSCKKRKRWRVVSKSSLLSLARLRL